MCVNIQRCIAAIGKNKMEQRRGESETLLSRIEIKEIKVWEAGI